MKNLRITCRITGRKTSQRPDVEKLFTGNGIELVRKHGELYLLYDAGEICDRMEEIRITEEEAEQAKKSSMDAYRIIIQHQNQMLSAHEK